VPTYDLTDSFKRDLKGLSREQRDDVQRALERFIEDLRAGQGFRKGLRVKGVQGASGVYEMTWADDGRATFEYGSEIIEGEPHIVWRRIGGHEIFNSP
jgi:hypothetical protein